MNSKYRRLKSYLTLISLFLALVASIWSILNLISTNSVTAPPIVQNTTGMESAYVSRVIDGDTIELSDGRVLRYIGVDTPETVHPTKGQECFGKEASNFNKELVLNKTVQLEKDVSETDRYGRILRYVWLDGQLVNKTLVEEGYAFARSFPPDIAKQDILKSAENSARESMKGLWGVCELNDQGQINQVINQADNVLGASTSSGLSDGCVIKGNISDNGYVYHLPECNGYSNVRIDESKGEKWFCTEAEAIAAGWRKSGNCPN